MRIISIRLRVFVIPSNARNLFSKLPLNPFNVVPACPVLSNPVVNTYSLAILLRPVACHLFPEFLVNSNFGFATRILLKRQSPVEFLICFANSQRPNANGSSFASPYAERTCSKTSRIRYLYPALAPAVRNQPWHLAAWHGVAA